MYNFQCSMFNDVSDAREEEHAQIVSALRQTINGSGNDVSNERWARAKIIWAFSNFELESVLKLHWRSNWLFILQFGCTSMPKIKLQSLHFSRPHAITIFKVIPVLHIQFLTRLWQGVQLDQVAIHSTGATSFCTPAAIYILLSICIYLPSSAPLCAQ